MSDNSQVPKEIQDYINKGKEAYDRHNYDYAIELFNHALDLDFSMVETRHLLHLTKIKRAKENPPSIISIGANKVKSQTFILNAKKSDSSGKTQEAIKEYEKALRFDPLNDSIYIKMAVLFEDANNEEAAIKTYQEALTVNPDSLPALKKLGVIFKDKGDFEKSRQYFTRAQQVAPNDAEVNKGLKDLAALQTIDKGGWEDQDTFRTKIEDKKEAEKLERETRKAKTSEDIDFLIKDTEDKLSQDPENTQLMFRLAEYYKQKNFYDKAQGAYNAILKLKPNNDVAMRNIEDLEIKKTEQQISQLQTQLKKNPSDDQLKQQLDELTKKKNNIHFEQLKSQVAKLPNDLALRFKYGLLLKQRGMLNEAIGQFQEAVKDPARRLEALNMLGLCFKEKNMYDLAVTQFKKALEVQPDLNETTKAVIYNLGSTYEQMGKIDEAVNEYKKIYEVDISYKDIAKKIEDAYKGK